MAILEFVINPELSNASNVMKMDIVNPMPPSNPTPITWFQLMPFGNVHNPNVTEIKLKRKIPSGLPRINPERIPMLTDCPRPVSQPFWMVMHVFANANKGKMRNVTGRCNRWSKILEGDFLIVELNGIANANRTPVIVGCTPEWSIKYHIINPPNR